MPRARPASRAPYHASVQSSRVDKFHPGEIVAVVGGGLLLLATWLAVASSAHVASWEVRVFRDLNGLPDALWPIVWVFMQVGSFVGSLVAVILTWAISKDRRLTLAVLLGTQAAFWAAKAVKASVSRARPGQLLSGVNLREHAGGLGYVSGHAAVAFALAAALGPSIPRLWRVPIAAVAVAVAFARVYSGAHLPLDVLGGAGLGLLCGTFARWALGLGGEGVPARNRV